MQGKREAPTKENAKPPNLTVSHRVHYARNANDMAFANGLGVA